MTPMPLKYETEVSAIQDCPAAHYRGRDATAYRFVFEARIEESFIPPLMKNPKRALTMSVVERCSGWALSFFSSQAAAAEFFSKLQKNNPKVHKAIGDSIAVGDLRAADGLAAEPDEVGHFDLHENRTVVLHDRFRLAQHLV
jgi:predicted SnoaL-like aldol condensation-catalyzing enzyme